MTIDERSRPNRRSDPAGEVHDRHPRHGRRDRSDGAEPAPLAYGADVSRHRFIRPVQPWERPTGS